MQYYKYVFFFKLFEILRSASRKIKNGMKINGKHIGLSYLSKDHYNHGTG